MSIGMHREKKKIEDLLAIKPIRLYERGSLSREDIKRGRKTPTHHTIFMAWVGEDECVCTTIEYSKEFKLKSHQWTYDQIPFDIVAYGSVIRCRRTFWNEMLQDVQDLDRKDGEIAHVFELIETDKYHYDMEEDGMFLIRSYQHNANRDWGKDHGVNIHDDEAIKAEMFTILFSNL